MSSIDDLIATHCPDGVQFRSIGEAALVVRMPGQVKREDFARGSTFPIVDQSLDFIAGYTDDPSLVVSRQPYVVFGDHTRAVKYVDFAFAQGADGIKALQAADGLTTRWLYYCLAHLDIPNRGYNRHWTVVRDLRIPVPPQPVQTEIMRVLDAFESLQTELEGELELRARQYAFYRDFLITSSARAGWRPMGEVGEFFRGRRFTKDDVVPDGIPSIHYGEIYTRYGVFAAEALSHVRAELESSLRFAKTGDVIIAGVGETVEDVGKAVAWLGEEDVAIHDDCFAFRHTLDPKFVAYYFQTQSFHSELATHVSRGKLKRISAASLGKLKIPVPPREEQERIVAVLDMFDALVNDLFIGLPAEIKARQAQYEFYRDRLLTFEELAA